MNASRALEETSFGLSFAHRFLCDRSWRFPVFNFFFLSYMICPRFCHRLVGYLEEEAVATYVGRYAKIPPARLQAPLAHALDLCEGAQTLAFCTRTLLQLIQCSLHVSEQLKLAFFASPSSSLSQGAFESDRFHWR